MQLWIVVTILAAAVQTVRFSLQKRVKTLGLSTGGATFSRFLFAAPIAVLFAIVLLVQRGQPVPRLDASFWAFAMAGGLGQIIATFCTVALFSERSFAVGIAFTKTETVQVALFSWLVLGDRISPLGLLAIVLGFIGVVLLSVPPRALDGRRGTIFNRATLLGLLAGAFFGASAVGYRGATLAIGSGDVLLRATLALASATTFQTLAMGAWLRWREPGELGRVFAAWRATALVGITGVTGSLGWFAAFAMANAAYVRSVGQIDLVFSFLVSLLIFHETVRRAEVAGVLFLVAAIVTIICIT